MAYSAEAVANFFIEMALTEKSKLNLMKLNKLIYMAQGHYLSFHDEPLIDEYIEAWSHGPVVSSVYHRLKNNGLDPLKKYLTNTELSEDESYLVETKDVIRDETTRELLFEIWDMYKQYTGGQLSNWTHLPGSPWEQAWNANIERIRNYQISNDSIKDYFSRITEDAKAEDRRNESV